jgi:hypothetical protein
VERPFLFHTDQWAAIVFYRGPECVPDSFNLLDFFDVPNAFACRLNVSGFEVWDNGPGVDSAPRQAVTSGVAVPVWIVSWPALQSALADSVLTIPELEALNPLKGIATNFHEVLHPFAAPGTSGGAKVPHLTIFASGELSDGRSFQLQLNDNGRAGTTAVRITLR